MVEKMIEITIPKSSHGLNLQFQFVAHNILIVELDSLPSISELVLSYQIHSLSEISHND